MNILSRWLLLFLLAFVHVERVCHDLLLDDLLLYSGSQRAVVPSFCFRSISSLILLSRASPVSGIFCRFYIETTALSYSVRKIVVLRMMEDFVAQRVWRRRADEEQQIVLPTSPLLQQDLSVGRLQPRERSDDHLAGLVVQDILDHRHAGHVLQIERLSLRLRADLLQSVVEVRRDATNMCHRLGAPSTRHAGRSPTS